MQLTEVEVLAQDTLRITFSESMLNDSILSDTASYTVSPVSTGVTTAVVDVLSGNNDTTTEIVLVVAKPTLDAEYTVTVNGVVLSVADNTMDPSFATKEFEARRTKMDSVLQNLTPVYTRSHRAILRNLFQAIAREDDLIGGNRDDFLT